MAPEPPKPEELPESFRDMMFEYTDRMMNLGHLLFELISEALGLSPDHLLKIDCAKGLDDIGGLQVLHENQWIDVPAVPGALVVNIGDLLQLISNDRLISVEHRALANSVGPRCSRGDEANWRDSVYCKMAPDPPTPEELPKPFRDMMFEYNDQPELTIGTSKHADSTFLTVLLQDHIGGLQVLHENQWIDVPPVPGALVVNIGDLLQLITNDSLVSVEHRVLANSVGPRVSVASFFVTGFHPDPRSYGPIKELLSDMN
ncbi:hypothetical protein V6N13_047521 [Hibiscus sabdariffa]